MSEQAVIDPREILNSAGYEDVPAVLLPYQQEWIADKSPLKVAEKSRRIRYYMLQVMVGKIVTILAITRT